MSDLFQLQAEERVAPSPRRRRAEKANEAFRTISEVSDSLDVPQHVLRFWETRFPQIRPLKRGGGRRYYRPEDVALLRSIKRLLHEQGYTIKGVLKLLKEEGVRTVVDTHGGEDGPVRLAPPAPSEEAISLPTRQAAPMAREEILRELMDLRDMLRAVL